MAGMNGARMNLSPAEQGHYDAMAVVMGSTSATAARTPRFDIRRDVFRRTGRRNLPFTGSLVALLKAMHPRAWWTSAAAGSLPTPAV